MRKDEVMHSCIRPFVSLSFGFAGMNVISTKTGAGLCIVCMIGFAVVSGQATEKVCEPPTPKTLKIIILCYEALTPNQWRKG